MSQPRWAVSCAEHTTPPRRTREDAERLLAQIEDLGACRLPHQVIPVTAQGKPLPLTRDSAPA